jgi:hypothetical protein
MMQILSLSEQATGRGAPSHQMVPKAAAPLPLRGCPTTLLG